MSHQRIGRVTHYYHDRQVAGVFLEGGLRVGDWLHFLGHTTDFAQQLTSLQIEHRGVNEAEAGEAVGVQVNERVREHDMVYRITAEDAQQVMAEREFEPTW
jgi:putative protease